MATIFKDLIGRLDLVGDVGGNTYNLVLPTQTGVVLPHPLDNQVIEEVYIICDTTLGPITINLPSTTLFNGTWNAKIYICWIAGVNNVIINPFEGQLEPTIIPADSLNGSFSSYTMENLYETNYLHIVWDYTWMKLVCAGPIPD